MWQVTMTLTKIICLENVCLNSSYVSLVYDVKNMLYHSINPADQKCFNQITKSPRWSFETVFPMLSFSAVFYSMSMNSCF